MTTTTLRINWELYNKIVEISRKDRRSINAEIQYIIERYLDSMKWYIQKQWHYVTILFSVTLIYIIGTSKIVS